MFDIHIGTVIAKIGDEMDALVLAAVTFLTRVGGFLLMARVRLTSRIRRILEAMPGSIVAAVVVPTVAMSGGAAIVALAAAIAIMIVCRSEMLAIAVAIAVAALARATGI